MNRDLIITGAQQVGKTLLGNLLKTNFEVFDEMNIELIRRHQSENSHFKHRFTSFVYITNDEVTYKDFDINKFLIIKLTKV